MPSVETQRVVKAAQPVPEFFQADDADSQIAQVEWLKDHLKLDDGFFGKVLEVTRSTLDVCHRRPALLNSTEQHRLVELWSMFLHLFTFLDHDYEQVHALLETPCRPAKEKESSLLPPWAGHSIRDHLEHNSPQAIDDVSRWVTSFRFT